MIFSSLLLSEAEVENTFSSVLMEHPTQFFTALFSYVQYVDQKTVRSNVMAK